MDRKNEIIYATLELASQQGLGTVSMQQIADKVGITKASLYNHFPSRDEIVSSMYEVLRDASKRKASIADADYDGLTDGRTLREILITAVGNYRRMVRDPQMMMFYRIIMTERSISEIASEIMVRETRTMIEATRRLFLAIQNKGLVSFEDLDSAAISFAMAVHSIIDYELDLAQLGRRDGEDMMIVHIDGFCNIYGKRKE